ncbi:S1 family peptidase [Streptomyces sp. NBC_01142]|uniref:S1 family peptidase n=1 Tax=Streptomyces sp. NBC_01142 TaxID=2975865 RepID=UPI00225B4F05|nr:S1 family peptidase [Streptomyces sp. NBC_01142]MCX4821436.1 S1 family peptidase [Streptomyces sp. NBC_01142]
MKRAGKCWSISAALAAATSLSLTVGAPAASGALGNSGTPGDVRVAQRNVQPGDSARDRRIHENQVALNQLANRLVPVPEDRRRYVPGFAGIVLDAEKATLVVYWKGRVPARISRILASAPRGVAARLGSAKYSKGELSRARDTLLAREDARSSTSLAAQGLSVGAVSVLADGSGLEAQYERTAARRPSSTETGTPSQTALERDIRTATGVPVDLTLSAAPRAANRVDDSSPWYGGGLLTNPNSKSCTAGFGATSPAGNLLITAAHCGASGQYSDGVGETIGPVQAVKGSLDTTVIRVTNGTSSWRYFDGPWDTQASKYIDGSATNWTGDYVCGSGAATGIRCNLKIINDDTYTIQDGVRISPVVQAERSFPADIALGKGDSGGPVVASTDGKYGENMTARGLISGGSNEIPCPVGGTSAPTTCYATLWYVPIRPILSHFGLTLRTDTSRP